MRSCLSVTIIGVLILIPIRAFALGEQLEFVPPNPTTADSVQVVISGQMNDCTSFLGNPILITFPPNNLVVTSQLFILPVGFCSPTQLRPYTQTASLGQLPSGTYRVGWGFQPPVIAAVARELIVTEAAVTQPAPVPISRVALATLAIVIVIAVRVTLEQSRT